MKTLLLAILFIIALASTINSQQQPAPPCEQVRDEWAARWEITESARSRLEAQLAAAATALNRAQIEINKLRDQIKATEKK